MRRDVVSMVLHQLWYSIRRRGRLRRRRRESVV